LSISIETRPEVGEGFAPIASLLKQFELIYVVGDERAAAENTPGVKAVEDHLVWVDPVSGMVAN
jgi:hypothetical protein